MATIPAITIPDTDLLDVLAGVERTWHKDAINLIGTEAAYDALADRQKLRACTMAFYRIHARNLRRELAERAISVPEVTPA